MSADGLCRLFCATHSPEQQKRGNRTAGERPEAVQALLREARGRDIASLLRLLYLLHCRLGRLPRLRRLRARKVDQNGVKAQKAQKGGGVRRADPRVPALQLPALKNALAGLLSSAGLPTGRVTPAELDGGFTALLWTTKGT